MYGLGPKTKDIWEECSHNQCSHVIFLNINLCVRGSGGKPRKGDDKKRPKPSWRFTLLPNDILSIHPSHHFIPHISTAGGTLDQVDTRSSFLFLFFFPTFRHHLYTIRGRRSHFRYLILFYNLKNFEKINFEKLGGLIQCPILGDLI
jgi:hypothetical protein